MLLLGFMSEADQNGGQHMKCLRLSKTTMSNLMNVNGNWNAIKAANYQTIARSWCIDLDESSLKNKNSVILLHPHADDKANEVSWSTKAPK